MESEKEEYYDSDIASVNEEDFLSDNEPPKEVLGEKRIITKEKFRRVYKSLYRLGYHVDKPAPYDRVTLKYKKMDSKPESFQIEGQFLTYNLGLNKDHDEILKLVSTMSTGEAALFQIQYLKMCQNTNIKVLDRTEFYLIDLASYATVIDLDNDKVFMKEVEKKGEGHFRVSECDEVVWEYSIKCNQNEITHKYQHPVDITQRLIEEMPRSVWRMLQTMKAKQTSFFVFDKQTFENVEGSDFYDHLVKTKENPGKIIVKVHVESFVKVDDIFFTQKLLKKTIRKGNSTNKASDGSIVYYCVGYFDKDGNLIEEDSNFNVDIDDLQELKNFDCHSHYLDEHKCSEMMKNILARMKPLQIAEFKCYDKSLIQYGWDHDKLVKLFGSIPDFVHMKIKVFNFTEQKTAYNTNVDEKLFHSERKKALGLKFIEQNQFKNAMEVFQNILYLFDAGVQTQEDKEKVSQTKLWALMNCSLCSLKLQDYQAVIDLCKRAKEIKPSQKCSYRLAFSYKKIGEAQKGLDELEEWSKISPLNEEMEALKVELEADLVKYNKKSKALYSNMFN